MKTATVYVRMNERLKTEAEKIIYKEGLTPSEAIRLFYSHIIDSKKIPFEFSISDVKTKSF